MLSRDNMNVVPIRLGGNRANPIRPTVLLRCMRSSFLEGEGEYRWSVGWCLWV